MQDASEVIVERGDSAFRSAERHYRKPTKPKDKRTPILETDFSNVIDFDDLSGGCSPDASRVTRVTIPGGSRQLCGLADVPGFYVIPSCLDEPQQRLWITNCVTKYPVGNPNNISNLSNNINMPTAWSPDLMSGLRWVSVGYHYQWTSRVYDENQRGPFPDDLAAIIADAAALAGSSWFRITPEASIINYYPEGTTMGGHLDNAEEDMETPIVSISLGATAVFLLGGPTKVACEKKTRFCARGM